MAESRAAGQANRAALYSVESPRLSLALDPDPAGLREATPHTHVCAYMLVCGHVCLSPGMLIHQLAVTELSMNCFGEP